MMRPVVCGALAIALAAGPGMAQTRAKAPAAVPSKSLADYSEAMENLSEAASPAVVQILVQGVAAVGQGESKRMIRAHAPELRPATADCNAGVRLAQSFAATRSLPFRISRLPTWLAGPTRPSFSMRSTSEAALL